MSTDSPAPVLACGDRFMRSARSLATVYMRACQQVQTLSPFDIIRCTFPSLHIPFHAL